MQKRRIALKFVHWILLATCIVFALAIARLFWWEAGEGREAREAERAAGALRQAQDAAPVGPPSISPTE